MTAFLRNDNLLKNTGSMTYYVWYIVKSVLNDNLLKNTGSKTCFVEHFKQSFGTITC